MWVVHTLDEDSDGSTTWRLMPGSIRTIGRAPQADFILESATVSRLHCRLLATHEGLLEVEDLGSTNGTFVNEARVGRASLAAGDRLRIGRVELVVAHLGPDRQTASPDDSAGGNDPRS